MWFTYCPKLINCFDHIYAIDNECYIHYMKETPWLNKNGAHGIDDTCIHVYIFGICIWINKTDLI